MKLNLLEKAILKSPFRSWLQREQDAETLFAGLKPLGDGCCLELGCGNGAGSLLISMHTRCGSLISSDYDPDMVRHARKMVAVPPDWADAETLGAIDFVAADAGTLPFPDDSFDAVFQFFVFEHMPEWRDGVGEIARVLKPGGQYIFQEGFIPDTPLAFNWFFGHVPFEREELCASLKSANLIVKRCNLKLFKRVCYGYAVKEV